MADLLPREELRRRALAGVSVIATRGVAVLLIGFAGTVVVARLLTPHDLGLIAVGTTILLFTSTLADGGLGGGLIRRREPPTREELEALMGLQLIVTTAVAVAVAVIAAPLGPAGWVTALMVASMPLVSLQFPGRILLERSLLYRPVAAVEVSQVLAYHLCAIILVVAGLGVWGLAVAAVFRAAVGAGLMAHASPIGLVRPRFGWRRIRPLLGFGLRFQAVSATWLVHDQGLNAAVAVVAGVATLGLWTLVRRLLEIPFLLFDSLWRVSFPAMSHLLAAEEDPAPLLERALGIAAIGAGTILTGLAASAPGLIPGVFGEQWAGATAALPGTCLGLGIAGSVSVATQGYLYAVGDVSAVLSSAVVQTVSLIGVTVLLLSPLGIAAIGIGSIVSSVLGAAVLARATRRRIQFRVLRPLVLPTAVGVLSASVGWVIAEQGGSSFISGLVGGACAVLCFHATLMLFQRRLVFESVRFVTSSLRAAATSTTPREAR
jgi:O-antigen/teichoic acid export membrane protein